MAVRYRVILSSHARAWPSPARAVAASMGDLNAGVEAYRPGGKAPHGGMPHSVDKVFGVSLP